MYTGKINVFKKLIAVFVCICLVLTAVPFEYGYAQTDKLEEGNIIESVSIDKILISKGETTTINIKVADGYIAEYISFYKPITKNSEVVSLNSNSNNMYVGTFTVEEQTESGIWEVWYIHLEDQDGNWVTINNSNNYAGAYYTTYDFSPLDFEVFGTNADIEAPVIINYAIDKSVVSAGECATILIEIDDEHLPDSFYFWYKSPSNISKAIKLNEKNKKGVYEGIITIDEETEKGLWKPWYFKVSDTNGNTTELDNSNVILSGKDRVDLSSLNFEVLEINNDSDLNIEKEWFIVIFRDGYGTTLSTQRVAKGEDAVEPQTPKDEICLFNGWDKEFTNITSNKVITATWRVNPSTKYDKECHIGESFIIEVFSTSSQNYVISNREGVDFNSTLVGTGMVFSDKLYYTKKYEIKVDRPGSYLFYVEGSRGSNTLSYKVKITDHDFKNEWTTDVAATCTTIGSKSRHCSICDSKKGVTVINKLGHVYADSYTIDKKATKSTDGSKSKHCTRLGCSSKSSVTSIPKISTEKLSSTLYTYDGKTKTPSVTVTDSKGNKLVKDTDYTVTYPTSRYKIGKYTVTITYKGKYSGTTKLTYTIGPKNPTTVKATLYGYDDVQFTWSKVTGAAGYKVYYKKTGAASYTTVGTTTATSYKIPNLADGTKYTFKVITYQNVGGNNCYNAGKTCEVSTKLPVTDFKASLSSTLYTYDGKAKTPSVTVKDAKGNTLVKDTDYTVTYPSSRTKIGKYTVTITYKGKYYGSTKLTYTIGPKNPSTVTAKLYGHDDVQVTWSKVSGAVGYKVYYKKSTDSSYTTVGTTTATSYKIPNLADGAKYTFKVITYQKVSGNNCYNAGKTCELTMLKKVTNVKAATSSSNVKVSWTDIAGQSGYQISQSTTKDGTSIVATYATTSGTSKTVTATKGKTYYYKVRAYKTEGETKIYGPWSDVVTFKRS